ncbi:uncharacterized protein LOC113315774 [Papaver somniferum]|uniref:uncharacterized protein LOC113315774 n=1 Tax=Papaver somniferum TaxID=3469 RepID=UPI000E704C75|nr:uncharacterized protein LOC113315774 [Papaver somniferum]
MVKHVLIAMPLHQMGTFQLPDSTIDELERVQRLFWWNKDKGKDITTIAWTKLCADKEYGEQQWAKSLKAKYFPNCSLLHAPEKNNATWAWKSMYKCVDSSDNTVFGKLGMGETLQSGVTDGF